MKKYHKFINKIKGYNLLHVRFILLRVLLWGGKVRYSRRSRRFHFIIFLFLIRLCLCILLRCFCFFRVIWQLQKLRHHYHGYRLAHCYYEKEPIRILENLRSGIKVYSVSLKNLKEHAHIHNKFIHIWHAVPKSDPPHWSDFFEKLI